MGGVFKMYVYVVLKSFTTLLKPLKYEKLKEISVVSVVLFLKHFIFYS